MPRHIFYGNWVYWVEVKVGHTVPAQKSNISKKMIGGGVLNLFLSKDYKTTLTFCQVIILLYTSSRLTKSSTLLSAPVLASRIYTSPYHWKLTDIFFPIWTLWGRCGWRSTVRRRVRPSMTRFEQKGIKSIKSRIFSVKKCTHLLFFFIGTT